MSLSIQGSPIIVNGDMSTTLTSLVTGIQYQDKVSIQLIFTGTPTGVFQVLGSINHKEVNNQVEVQGTFDPITLSSSPVASGTSGSILLNLSQLAFPYIQVIYTPSGGVGTLNAFISTKDG